MPKARPSCCRRSQLVDSRLRAAFINHFSAPYLDPLPFSLQFDPIPSPDAPLWSDRHPETLQSIYNLASLLQRLGELEPAVTLYEEELAACAERYGIDHKETKVLRRGVGTPVEHWVESWFEMCDAAADALAP